MPQRCTVCAHEQRNEIDRALVAGTGSKAGIARKYGLDDSAVDYHAAHHLPRTLVRARKASEVFRAGSLLKEMQWLVGVAKEILGEARKGPGHWSRRDALAAIRELRELTDRVGGIAETMKATEVQARLKSRQEIQAGLETKLRDFRAKHEAVKAQAEKCPRCGQALPPGMRVEVPIREGPKPTGPGVH